ncbi:hypothetical protein SSCG_02800 [Streptomyces clavuligerus]|nr:hypothetical protein SSCG_02800 [Streptomyces clavuligerus]
MGAVTSMGAVARVTRVVNMAGAAGVVGVVVAGVNAHDSSLGVLCLPALSAGGNDQNDIPPGGIPEACGGSSTDVGTGAPRRAGSTDRPMPLRA